MLSSATQFVVICHTGPRKLIDVTSTHLKTADRIKPKCFTTLPAVTSLAVWSLQGKS